jgi:peptide-methionine (S)-S-oxide reductase
MKMDLIKKMLGVDAPIKTEIIEHTSFYDAEDYHQNYAHKNPTRYKFYRWNCGRDARLQEIWKK